MPSTFVEGYRLVNMSRRLYRLRTGFPKQRPLGPLFASDSESVLLNKGECAGLDNTVARSYFPIDFALSRNNKKKGKQEWLAASLMSQKRRNRQLIKLPKWISGPRVLDYVSWHRRWNFIAYFFDAQLPFDACKAVSNTFATFSRYRFWSNDSLRATKHEERSATELRPSIPHWGSAEKNNSIKGRKRKIEPKWRN